MSLAACFRLAGFSFPTCSLDGREHRRALPEPQSGRAVILLRAKLCSQSGTGDRLE